MHKLSPVFVFALAAILATSLSCAKKPDDAKISSEIQGKYSQDSGLSSKQLTVQASNGVVTLTGFVDNDAQRAAAARQAASVEGVREVINNLQVGTASNPSAAPPAPAAKIADAKPARSMPGGSPASARKPSRSRVAEDPAMGNDSASSTLAEGSQPPAPTSQDEPSAGVPPSSPPPPPAPPQPLKVTIEQGTSISVRLIDSIDSETNQPGDSFHASLNAPLSAEGSQVIPAGADITGHIVDLKSAGKFAGQSLVVLQLDSIAANGKSYNLQTDQFRKEGSSRGKNTAEKVGGGAIVGGIIGALAGGGKGAAIGTAAGAGVGGGAQAASKSQQIKLPSETILTFTLQAPVTVIKQQDPNAGRQKLGDSP
jgi:hypothetical protein